MVLDVLDWYNDFWGSRRLEAEEELNDAIHPHNSKKFRNDIKQQFLDKENKTIKKTSCCDNFCYYLLCCCIWKYFKNKKGKVEFSDDKFHNINHSKMNSSIDKNDKSVR